MKLIIQVHPYWTDVDPTKGFEYLKEESKNEDTICAIVSPVRSRGDIMKDAIKSLYDEIRYGIPPLDGYFTSNYLKGLRPAVMNTYRKVLRRRNYKKSKSSRIRSKRVIDSKRFLFPAVEVILKTTPYLVKYDKYFTSVMLNKNEELGGIDKRIKALCIENKIFLIQDQHICNTTSKRLVTLKENLPKEVTSIEVYGEFANQCVNAVAKKAKDIFNCNDVTTLKHLSTFNTGLGDTCNDSEYLDVKDYPA